MKESFSKTQWLLIVAATIGVALLAIESQFGVRSSTRYTCLQCRAELEKEKWLGVPRVRVVENDCSRWYAAAHPEHEHEWCRSGCELTQFLTGKMASCGKSHPIWGMPAKVQLEFMRSASAVELDAFWKIMTSASREDQDAAVTAAFEKVLDQP